MTILVPRQDYDPLGGIGTTHWVVPRQDTPGT